MHRERRPARKRRRGVFRLSTIVNIRATTAGGERKEERAPDLFTARGSWHATFLIDAAVGVMFVESIGCVFYEFSRIESCCWCALRRCQRRRMCTGRGTRRGERCSDVSGDGKFL